jgi:tRNA1(Val) A37 N6-methylase TrmN6
LTAWYAATAEPGATEVFDLGSGIGSVPMMLAHALPAASIEGVEAQEVSLALARRSLAWNGLEARVHLRGGDLRDAAAVPRPGAYQLCSGTPPYVPPGRGKVPLDSQKAYCRFELRGGVEDYARTAARALRPEGSFVFCFDARHPDRVHAALGASGLVAVRWREVVPRVGRAPLFTLFQARFAGGGAGPGREPPLVVRDEQGRRTEEMKDVRRRMAMPPTD